MFRGFCLPVEFVTPVELVIPAEVVIPESLSFPRRPGLAKAGPGIQTKKFKEFHNCTDLL